MWLSSSPVSPGEELIPVLGCVELLWKFFLSRTRNLGSHFLLGGNTSFSLLILPRQAWSQWAGEKNTVSVSFYFYLSENREKSPPFPLFQCVGFNTRSKRFPAVLRDIFSCFPALWVSQLWCGRQGGQLGFSSLRNPERSGDQLTLEKSSVKSERINAWGCSWLSLQRQKSSPERTRWGRGTAGTREIGIKSSMQNCH